MLAYVLTGEGDEVGAVPEAVWHILPHEVQARVLIHGRPVRDYRTAGQHKRNGVYGRHRVDL